MSTDDEPPPRYSDPGERISLTDLEEIKPLGSRPPPVPDEVAEHFDLDEAMTRALSSVAAPPAPTINVDAPPRREKRSSASSKNLRPLQAALAVAIGAAIAWFVQERPADEPNVTESTATESASAIAQADTTQAQPSIPEMAAVERMSSIPVSASEAAMNEVGVSPPAEPSEPVVAQRPEEAEEDDREDEREDDDREREPREERQAAAESESETTAEANPHLPADYHTPEAQAEREARREERRQAEAAAQASAEQAAEEEAVRAELPPHPDREAVREAMERVRGAIEECAGGRHGTATLRITVHHSGRVQGSIVEGGFSGTPEGSCMALAARRARFPRFSEDRFSLTYPFTF